MNVEERQLIADVFAQLRDAGRGPKDQDADRFIQDLVRQLPDAPYFLTQSVIVQQQALEQADAQISSRRPFAKRRTPIVHRAAVSSVAYAFQTPAAALLQRAMIDPSSKARVLGALILRPLQRQRKAAFFRRHSPPRRAWPAVCSWPIASGICSEASAVDPALARIRPLSALMSKPPSIALKMTRKMHRMMRQKPARISPPTTPPSTTCRTHKTIQAMQVGLMTAA